MGIKSEAAVDLQSPGQMGRNRLWLISEQQHFKNVFAAWI
jgi:hypothetical protein